MNPKQPLISALFVFVLVLNGCSTAQKSPRVFPNTADTATQMAIQSRQCPVLYPASTDCTLNRTPGNNDLWLYGDVLADGTIYENGVVQIDNTGKISDVGCLNIPATAAVLSCPNQVISPGLINPHDHLAYNHNWPGGQNNSNSSGQISNPDYQYCNNPVDAHTCPTCEGYRYDRRNEWREGLAGKKQIVARKDTSDEKFIWNELRHVMAGTTSVAGSGGYRGFVRNPDRAHLMEGLQTSGNKHVDYQTFPLGDAQNTAGHNYGDCQYPKVVTPAVLNNLIFLPHVAEGINEFARNELLCLTGAGNGSVDLKADNSTFIHSVAAEPADIDALQKNDMTAVWSPRSNISLYGNTAQVTLYHTLGLRIALSTDWTPSGSINMLRELQCASNFNKYYLFNRFTSQDLWEMTTINAAHALGIDDQVGLIKIGYWADISIFDPAGQTYANIFDVIINADAENVSMVLRAGKPLSGQANIVTRLDGNCEQLAKSVCGKTKAVCPQETGFSMTQLTSANSDSYPLFFCGKPADEPTCIPSRYQEYSGEIVTTDIDGDGIDNIFDNCPTIFNPIRPLDNGAQADANGDGVGDVCDSNPL